MWEGMDRQIVLRIGCGALSVVVSCRGAGTLLWKHQTKVKRGRVAAGLVQGRRLQTPGRVTPGSSSVSVLCSPLLT